MAETDWPVGDIIRHPAFAYYVILTNVEEKQCYFSRFDYDLELVEPLTDKEVFNAYLMGLENKGIDIHTFEKPYKFINIRNIKKPGGYIYSKDFLERHEIKKVTTILKNPEKLQNAYQKGLEDRKKA